MHNWLRVGHRGAPHEFPANSMRGFERAFELGCDMVECDVRLSRDRILVLSHDPQVTDVDGKTYDIANLDYASVVDVDLSGGARVPTLDELVAWAVGRCAVMADMKCDGDGVEDLVIEALRPLPIAAKVVPGAGAESRRRFLLSEPDTPLSLSLNCVEGAILIERLGFERLLDSLNTVAVTWEHPLLNAERIDALHARGVRAFAWTVDEPEVMRRLIADDIDGIISNRPDLFASL